MNTVLEERDQKIKTHELNVKALESEKADAQVRIQDYEQRLSNANRLADQFRV